MNSLVDSNPSLDRVYVFDGKIMYASPFASLDYIEKSNKVVDMLLDLEFLNK